MSVADEQNAERHMSDAEALMWAAERDPWLSSAMGCVAVCNSPVDVEWFTNRLAGAVAALPRLRERVIPSVRGLATPRWATDAHFDLDRHIITVDADGLNWREHTANVFTTPFDTGAPLWNFTIVQDLPDGGCALIMKLHHSIADGQGTLRLAEEYVDFTADAVAPQPIDLQPVLEQALLDNPPPADLRDLLTDSARQFARRQFGLARRAAGEVSLWGADPGRVSNAVGEVANGARVMSNQMGLGDGSRDRAGSTLWQTRSRHRRYLTMDLDLSESKAVAKALGGSLNDWFVTGVNLGAQRYHAARETTAPHFTASVVVSIRDGAAGGNAFTPVSLPLPGGPSEPAGAFATNKKTLARLTASARAGGAAAELMAGAAAMMPAGMISRAARSRARGLDFATSNVPGSPVPLWVGGATINQLYPVGPAAGTAFNVTALSYGDALSLGFTIDPVAVDEPDDLVADVSAALADLQAAATT